MDVIKFSEKLNKLDGNIYTIEEVVNPVDGVYEADLEHDNIDPNTINIYTGSKLTGDKINTYTISTPSLTPWRTHIRVYSNEPTLYITYETIGDTVEADDINTVQDVINLTQEELNHEISRAENAETLLQQNIDNEVTRAKKAEQTIQTNLNNEAMRATNAENTIKTDLNNEINRATNSENTIKSNLNNEITRAQNAEKQLQTNLNNETTRATNAENTITTNLNAEITRAKNTENTITTNLNSEVTRAKNIEASLTNDLSAETTRAKKAESTLTTNLNSEITRAQKAETDLNNTINTNKPKWDDKYTKAEVDNKINLLLINTAWKDSVATFADLATTYPNAQDGWTVYVEDTGYTFRYDNNSWVKISTYNLPLATASHDGRMSKADKSFLDTVKSMWTNITTHITDTVKHITSAERTLWNTVSNKLDKSGGKISNPNYRGQLEINRDANGDDYYAEIVFSNQVKGYGGLGFSGKDGAIVSSADGSKHYKIYHEGNKPKLSELTNDAGYIKSTDSVATQSHTHSNKSVLDKITQTNLNAWNDKLDKTGGTITGKISIQGSAASKPLNVRGINGVTTELNGDDALYLNYGTDKPVYINSENNEVYHKGNLTKISQLTNDAGYIKSTDNIATQSHTHSNKDVLDKITNYDLTHYIFTKGTGSNKNNMWYKLATMTITKKYDDCTVLFHVQDCGHGEALSNSGFIQMRVKQQDNLGQLPYCSLVLLNMYGLNANNFKLVVTENTIEKSVVSLYYYNPKGYSTLNVKIINTTALYNLTLHDKEEPISSLPSGTQISAIDTQKNYIKKAMTWNELEGI